ncbi:MAG: penicillin-binding protein 2 [Lachnospiraceae bacterium]|nr:penicillin-binding protein 2 [Lachnospiraceae bacterium]
MKSKLLGVLAAFLALFVVLTGRIVYLNVVKGAEYKEATMSGLNYESKSIPYRRGDIYDVNGTLMATSKLVYDITLEPKNILEFDYKAEATREALKEYFGFTDAQLNSLLEDEESYYEMAKKGVSYEEVKPFKDFCETNEGADVVGVKLIERYIRVYPNNELCCHLLGSASNSGGEKGVEEGYDDVLNGTNGREYSYYDAKLGKTNVMESPVNGYNVITSMDANAQKIIQAQVEKHLAKEGAKNVSVLVMEPNTCRVIALYNSHQYDPNDAYDIEACAYQFETPEAFAAFKASHTDAQERDALEGVWRNFALADNFEPGSTYKTFTISGALEDDVIKPTDSFVCDGGQLVGNYNINCHYTAGHGAQDVGTALANSCNDAMMQISALEGAKVFDKYQQLFGFGQRTGIDIPGEMDSESLSTIIYHEDTLNETELATSSFGQGVSVTMIELGTAFCSVVNGGYYYRPSVGVRVEDENGNVIDNLDPVLVRRTLSAEVSDEVKKDLLQVVESGTGSRAAVEGYTIGGKTGTAEKLPRGNGKYLISFIGFAPVENPQVVVYVVVDEPDVEDQSSSAAASYLFADIAKELFPYLNIYRDGEEYTGVKNEGEIIDELATPIYSGEVPENDVAGGEDNQYVREAMEEGASEPVEGETQETEGDSGGEEEYEEEYYEEENYEEFTDEDGDGVPDEWG